MGYKLLAKPEEVYYLITKEFTIADDDGEEYECRIGASSKGDEYWVWKEGDGGWNEVDDSDMLDYLTDEFPDDEAIFEFNELDEDKKKMEQEYEKFIGEKGEITDSQKFRELVSSLALVQNRDNDYYKRYYHAVDFAQNKIKFQENEQ